MEQDLPDGFHSEFVDVAGLRLHVVHNAKSGVGGFASDPRYPILMLHGFPEFWIAWEAVLPSLADDYLLIVPDQRGYNLSDAPEGVENYRVSLLVQDMLGLVGETIRDRPLAVAGHDWGASVAYAMAIHRPEQISHLIIANGVHPASFQQALIDDPAQAAASGYFHILRRDDAGPMMAADDFKRTFGMFERFSLTPWLTEELRKRYRKAWSDSKRLSAMLNWYNSSPIVVPLEGKHEEDVPLYNVAPDKLRISMPHLLFWGMGDTALLPICHQRLAEFCDQLETVEVNDADHWILHTHGKLVADGIRKFVGER